MPGEGSFLARCALKFSEVVAAGVATALSGYVIAHFAAPMFSATEPTAGPHGDVSGAAATLPVDDSAPHRAAKTEAKLGEPAARAPALPRRSKSFETRAAIMPGSAAARHPRDEAAQSLEARVRAALAHSNGRTAPAGTPRRQVPTARAVPNAAGGVEPRQPAAAVAETPAAPASLSPHRFGTAPQPAEFPPNPATLATQMTQAPGQIPSGQTPFRQDMQDPAGQNPGGQNSAIRLTPLTTVVIKPAPAIGTGSPQPPPTADGQAPGGDDSGPFSAFARILRSDKPLPEDQAPRPPVAVGQ